MAKAPITEMEIAGVKVKHSKQAFSVLFYAVDALENIAKFNERVIKKEKQLSEAIHTILNSDAKIKCINSQAIDVLFNETKKIFNKNSDLVGKISIIEREKYKMHEKMTEVEQLNHTLKLENASLKQELEIEKDESNKHLSQVYRLQNKIEEIKRMENEEFFKVKRDEIKVKKTLEDVRLKFKRANDALDSVKQKEDQINELKGYFEHKRQEEEQIRIKKQLKYEQSKFSLLGLIRNKDKTPILCLVDYLEMPEINMVAMLNKDYRNALWNESTFVWKSAYRNVNLSHDEIHKELQRQIDVKTNELKNIVPQKEFDIMKVLESENEVDLREILQKYIVDEKRVGEWIQNTMYNTKIFLNKQYNYMQKLFKEEEDRIRRERDNAQRKPSQGGNNSGGLLGRFFSGFGGPQQQKESIQEVQQPEEKPELPPKEEQKDESNYLLSTTNEPSASKNPQTQSDNLIDFGDEDSKDTEGNEQEVRVKMEDKDDEESKHSESETLNETVVDDPQEISTPVIPKKVPENIRHRSDSISSTSTSKIYSYNDFNDFLNIDELHKFIYKWGAMLCNQKGKMEEWIDWMQRTLAEYYVYWQILYRQAKDVEILKDFLSQKLQRTRYRLDQVINEKEDLIEQQAAEAGIKEYLAKQMQDLNVKNVEKTHELVLVKQKLSEVNSEIKDIEHEYKYKLKDIEKTQGKLTKEVKHLRNKLKLAEIENVEYKEIFDEMQAYVLMVNKTMKSK